jgi:hypothetical protein
VVRRTEMRRRWREGGRRGRNDSFWGMYGLGSLSCLLAWLGVGWALMALVGSPYGWNPFSGPTACTIGMYHIL